MGDRQFVIANNRIVQRATKACFSLPGGGDAGVARLMIGPRSCLPQRAALTPTERAIAAATYAASRPTP
jgi:hypothetical protein